MSEPHAVLNALDAVGAEVALRRCCGSERWVRGMLRERPFASAEELFAAAQRHFAQLGAADWLEAFSHHPLIGEDLADLKQRFGGAASKGPSEAALALSNREQSGITGASQRTLLALRDANRLYRKRFGYIFIVCASGKTAAELLDAISARLHNEPAAELGVAAAEQAKITRLRLEGLSA